MRADCTLAPVTHAFGGSKLRVGDMLKKAGGPPLPLVAAMRGVEDKLPLWACEDGCDFIRGTRLMNVTLKPKDIAISTVATSCLLSMWRVIDPVLIQPDLCKAAKYTVPLIDLPDCLPKFRDSAVALLSRMTDFSNTVLLDSIQSVWQEWNFQDRSIFQLKWIETIVNSGILLGLGPQRQLLIECSGLGGAPIFDSFQGDLFLKCMSTTPVYGPSLAHLDVYADNPKYRRSTSIGRTAQIHDFHMLHVAAWPTGVKAWTRILSLMNLPDMPEAQTDKILTQASVLAATGKKLPAHLRDAHPGFELGLRLILDFLLPVPLRTYLTNVLSPIVSEDSGWLMASADPSIRDAIRELHIIGHSAGSFTAMVMSDILQDPISLGLFLGVSPCPAGCLKHTIRSAKSICTMYWKMNFVYGDRQRKMWHSSMTMASRSPSFQATPYGWENETTAMGTSFSLALGQVCFRFPRSSMSLALFRCLKNKKPHCASCPGALIACRTRPNTCFRP